MLNRNIILSVSEDISKWEGVIYPDIYESPVYDNMGNYTGRDIPWLSLGKYNGNAGSNVHTGIFLQNVEVSGIQMSSLRGAEIYFWTNMKITSVYLARVDKNIKLTLNQNRGYTHIFESSSNRNFFSISDKGKGIPIILSSNPL